MKPLNWSEFSLHLAFVEFAVQIAEKPPSGFDQSSFKGQYSHGLRVPASARAIV
jgi:hypothetical protein